MSIKINYPEVVCLLCMCVVILNGCSEKKRLTATDSPKTGTIHISADESFKPVIDEEIKMYESSFPGTKIIADYKPEADCFKDILNNPETRMIIVTRGLNSKEEKYFQDSLNYIPTWNDMATDAIVVVVNAKSTDTVYTLRRLQEQLSGNYPIKKPVVFDGFKATSTVRYAIDSILKGKPFDTAVVKAVKNSRAVLDYVASDVNAIGLVGISWIGNPEDSVQVNMLKKVKMAYVECHNCGDSLYIKPTQLGILTKKYPLVRGLYYILKENYTGLGTGFVNFLQFERGQLIFRRSYLGPTRMGFAVRTVNINQKLKKE